MSALCVVDQIPATEGHLCTPCSLRFKKLLLRVPSLLTELDVTITKQARQTRDRGRSSSETSLVFNVSASDAAANLRQALRAVVWVASPSPRVVFEESAVELVHRALSGWSALCRSDQVAQRYWQLVDAVREAVRVIDVEPQRVVVGSCDCGAQLSAVEGADEVRCRACGVLWETADLTRMRTARVAGHLERFVTAREMSALFAIMGQKVPAATIRQWVKRRKLQVYSGPAPLHGIWATDAWELWKQKNRESEDVAA